MTRDQDRLRPKLTEEDRMLCARLLTAFIAPDKEMLEMVLAQVDRDDAVTAVMLGLLDQCAFVMEHTGPLPGDQEEEQA
jgi:hypothetical protein